MGRQLSRNVCSCSMSPEHIILNWVKSTSSCASVSLNEEIVPKRFGVILRDSRTRGEVPPFAMSTPWLKDGMSSSGTKWIAFPKKL